MRLKGNKYYVHVHACSRAVLEVFPGDAKYLFTYYLRGRTFNGTSNIRKIQEPQEATEAILATIAMVKLTMELASICVGVHYSDSTMC